MHCCNEFRTGTHDGEGSCGVELLRARIGVQGDGTYGEGAGQDRSDAGLGDGDRHGGKRRRCGDAVFRPDICSGEPCSSGSSSCSTCSTAQWLVLAAAERGTGRVLDATCDRVADGAIFAGLAWWAVYHENSKWLLVATLICLVTSQVISYAKARAEASGLTADGGWIERPDRLIIVLVGSGLTGMGLPWAIHIAMWVLAAGSIVTVFQRVLAVRQFPWRSGTSADRPGRIDGRRCAE